MLKDYFLLFSANMKIVLEYKLSFVIQAITMIISNTSFFIIWYFIFDKFWTFGWFWFRDYMILLNSVLMSFSIVHILFWWYSWISRWSTNWSLDNFLLMPRSVLFKILASWLPNSIFWDLLNALILPFLIPDFWIWDFLLLFYLSFIWWIIYISFIVTAESLSFYLWSSKELSRALHELILWPPNYPQKIFEWTIFKLLFVTIIPVYYVFYLPFNLIENFEWKWFAILHIAAVVFVLIWYLTFKNWLKRYESWNLINSNIN
ncbi:MAG: hypothetical protein ACD_2C00088G0005 [uncultured bacterium (gcode 4)]|uniref:ABC transporter permease protein n=1 Tax=uncultured bacterium (gcode 4) TaxID=1234023 RepID=K2H1W5_9BACT|nr:MAG: hypothetical protein ACD_2C00088G0005 [uncultured bacterium (gcode 4)]